MQSSNSMAKGCSTTARSSVRSVQCTPASRSRAGSVGRLSMAGARACKPCQKERYSGPKRDESTSIWSKTNDSAARRSKAGVSIHVLPYAPRNPRCRRSMTRQMAFMASARSTRLPRACADSASPSTHGSSSGAARSIDHVPKTISATASRATEFSTAFSALAPQVNGAWPATSTAGMAVGIETAEALDDHPPRVAFVVLGHLPLGSTAA